MKKILVTGAAGYVGLHAVIQLLDSGYYVVGIDNLSNSYNPPILPNFSFYNIDIGNFSFVRNILEEHKDIAACLHLAGSIYVQDSIKKPALYYRNNVSNSLIFLEACLAAGIQRIVFSSSASVYGHTQDLILSEDHNCNPIHPYGRSKLACEWILKDMANSGTISYVILRYFNVAGADLSLRIGQNSIRSVHLIDQVCKVATGQEKELIVFGTDYNTPDGSCIRDYIHVSDLAVIQLKALDYLLDEQGPCPSVVLNCGYGTGFSVKQIVEAAKDVAGYDFPVRYGARRAGDVARLVASNKNMQKLFSWHPQYNDLKIILGTALNWEEKRLKSESGF